jgi:hypothetical protein
MLLLLCVDEERGGEGEGEVRIESLNQTRERKQKLQSGDTLHAVSHSV